MTTQRIIEVLLWPVYWPVFLLLRLLMWGPENETDRAFRALIALIISAVIELGLGIWGVVYLVIYCFGN